MSSGLEILELNSNSTLSRNPFELYAQNDSTTSLENSVDPQSTGEQLTCNSSSNANNEPEPNSQNVQTNTVSSNIINQNAILAKEESCIQALDDSNTLEIDDIDDDSNAIGVIEIGKMEYPGRIFVTEENQLAVFYNTPFNEDTIKIIINPIGLLETKIVPHPSTLDFGPDVNIEDDDMPATLLITYLQDLFDSSSYKTFVFNGVRKYLAEVSRKATEISTTLKDKLLFRGPDLTPEIYPPTSKNYKTSFNRRRSAPIPRIDYIPFELINGESTILTKVQIDTVRLAIPFRYRTLSWFKLYDMTLDGVSINTLYSKVQNKMPLMLVIESNDHGKFGTFLSCGLKLVKGYSGTGETFIFRFAPDFEIYKWSTKNSFFVAASVDDLSIGGGKTGAAIYINKYMTNGVSDPCETFNSPQLSKKNQFKILKVEVWHICATEKKKK